MILDRLYRPTADEVVYHYCSASTFHAMIESGNIRFSDVNMLNDSAEIRLGYGIFEEAADILLKRKGIGPAVPVVDIDFINRIDSILSGTQTIFHHFVACFSADGDNLHQWRSYGDDGRGFAIGFRASSLKALPVTLLKIQYDKNKQLEEMLCAIVAMHMRVSEKSGNFVEDCVLLGAYLAAFKHSAFEYEKEVRCLHGVNVNIENEKMSFSDPGGNDENNEFVSGQKIEFQVRENHLVAYFDMPYRRNMEQSPVVEIVFGPKNFSAAGNIQLFLGSLGLGGVRLIRSKAPYR